MARSKQPQAQRRIKGPKKTIVQRFDAESGWRQEDEARDRFLAQVRESAPQVLQELRSLISQYSDMPEKWQNLNTEIPIENSPKLQDRLGLSPSIKAVNLQLGRVPRAWDWSDVQKLAQSGDPTGTAFCQDLRNWAARWIKDEPPWLMLEALAALHRWHQESTNPNLVPPSQLDWAPRDPFPSYVYHSTTLQEPLDFVFPYRGWRFEGENPREWMNELEAAFHAARDDYLQQVSQFVTKEYGEYLVQVAATRQTSAWYMPAFVDYQILNVGRIDLSAKYERSRESIDDMLRFMGKLLGIKPRFERRRSTIRRGQNRRTHRQKPVRTGIMPAHP